MFCSSRLPKGNNCRFLGQPGIMADDHFLVGHDGKIGAAVRPCPGVNMVGPPAGELGVEIWLVRMADEHQTDGPVRLARNIKRAGIMRQRPTPVFLRSRKRLQLHLPRPDPPGAASQRLPIVFGRRMAAKPDSIRRSVFKPDMAARHSGRCGLEKWYQRSAANPCSRCTLPIRTANRISFVVTDR